MQKHWTLSRIIWIGIVGFVGYGADAILTYAQAHAVSGCVKRSALSSLTFLGVTYLRTKTNTSVTTDKGLQ